MELSTIDAQQSSTQLSPEVLQSRRPEVPLDSLSCLYKTLGPFHSPAEQHHNNLNRFRNAMQQTSSNYTITQTQRDCRFKTTELLVSAVHSGLRHRNLYSLYPIPSHVIE